jgi:hypothetical protein
MASFPSFLLPMPSIPKTDSSWLSGVFDSIGGAVQRGKENASFNALADRIGAPTTAPSAPTSPAPITSTASSYGSAPVTPVDRGKAQGSTYEPFISTVRGRVTNPYGLAAVAATGRAESGWSAGNADRTWSDPSQSGQAGTAGGVMSWRGPRLASLQNYAKSKGEQGNGSPQTQAEFFLQENPQLIEQLNKAGSPQEAADIMANAWRFAGYDQQGGEAARRRALAQNYYAQEFGKNNAAAAIDAVAPPSGYVDPVVSTPNSRGFDAGRFGNAAPVAQGPEGLVSALTASNAPPAAAVYNPPDAPSAGPSMLAAGVTPVQRGGVDPSLIQFMLRDPNLRDVGLKLWAANAGQQRGQEPWQFVTLPDGTLARANQQTGAIERVGQFAKPQEQPTSYREYQLAKESGFQGTYADWEKVKTPGTSVTVNNQDQNEFSKKAAARNVERFGNLADTGTQSASVAQSMPVLRELLTQAPQGPVSGRLAEMFPGFSTAGDAFMAQVNQIAPTLRVPGSGAMSDRDMDILMSSLPRLRGDPAANQMILNVFERKAQLNAERGAIASAALRGEIKPEEADKRIAEIDKQPLLDERSRSMLSNSKGGTARPQTQADFDALESGELYIDPDDGQTYRKP